MLLRPLLAACAIALSLAPSAIACPNGNPNNPAYMLRDNNRCEGLIPRPQSSSLELISYATNGIGDSWGNSLSIRVNGISNPQVLISSKQRSYQLDRFRSGFSSNGFRFQLPTNVLQGSGISPSRLLAVAESSDRYYPVILNQATGRYSIVLFVPRRATITTLELRNPSGQVVWSRPRTAPVEGELRETWDYGNAPAGEYRLVVRTSTGDQRTFYLRHDRRWLN
ncbi:hypothetical protein [Limnothrix redekei]|uniref:FlgD Ig-like domain-containing protein n=1 Tax=Limnothrix redekei LRLZ20PSL1 TaxID=3112953 RepID=A0ABW7C762_9CYAN